MANLVPVLIGTAGLVNGECFVLAQDTELTVGRSRSCDVSLRHIAAYISAPADERDNDHDFNTVSRRHIRLKVSNSQASIQDLSTNGTFCNGEQVKESRSVDLSQGGCTIRLGTRESFQLVLLSKDDPRVRDLQTITPGLAAQSSPGDDTRK